MNAVEVRPFRAGDERGVHTVLDACFRGIEPWSLETVTGWTSAADFDPDSLLLAVEREVIVGCVRSARLPRGDAWVLRELAALPGSTAGVITDSLLESMLIRLDPLEPVFLRARTPALEPYLSAYGRRGFTPVRKVLRMAWHLAGHPPTGTSSSNVRIAEAMGIGADTLAELYLAGLRPYWDWWIEDRGGPGALRSRLTTHFRSASETEVWLVAEFERRPVGLAGASELGEDEIVLEGVYVLPESRGRGIGSTLMNALLAKLRQGAAKRLVVYDTFSFLDVYPPAVRLYLKSGARVEAEFLHLERWTRA